MDIPTWAIEAFLACGGGAGLLESARRCWRHYWAVRKDRDLWRSRARELAVLYRAVTGTLDDDYVPAWDEEDTPDA